MKLIMGILIMSVIGVMGFYFVDRVGAFFDENADRINNMNRTKLLHLGFDTPCLAENFIFMLKQNQDSDHPMEVIVYSGMKEELWRMLLAGELDYVILTTPITGVNVKKVKCKELLLEPGILRTSAEDIHIEMAEHASIKAFVFWIPGWINRENEYFSDLIMKLDA